MSSGSAGAGAAAPLLGRREELAELSAGLEDARHGRGRLFLLAGEGGIGKTRLLEALIEQAQPAEVRTAWGRCWEAGGVAPFWPWRQVLAACIAQVSSDALLQHVGPGRADVAQLAPELARRIPGLGPAGLSESPDARLRLFDAVTEFLLNVAADGGLVVALDDMHAADEASLRLLEHVADRLNPSNLLVVVTYRDAEVRSRPQIHRRMASIACRGRRVVLSGLDQDDVACLLEQVTGEASLAWAGDVYNATDGNPFFVQEVGRFVRTQVGGTGIPIPEEMHSLVRRRLEPVPQPVRQVLRVGAVIGREFDLSVLQAAGAVDADALLDALGEAVSLHVLTDAGLGRWSFSHAVLREVLYDDMGESQRVALHRRVGEALEQRQGEELDSSVAELAHNFFEAARGGDGAKAHHYCTLAGDEAMASRAFEEAAIQYGRALQALARTPPVDERLRYDLLMRLGHATFRLRDLPQAREIHRRALKSARALGSADLLARAALGFFGEPESIIDESRASVLEEARTALPEDDSALRAKVLVALAAATGNREAATELSNQGLAMARKVGDVDTLREVLWQWHHIKHDPDLLGERLAVADELLRLAVESGDRESVQKARQWRAYDLFAAGDVTGMTAELELAVQEAEELRLSFLTWGAKFQLAAAALLQGRGDEAERLAHEALAAGERSEFADVEGAFSYQLYAVRREQGRVEEMVELARRRLEGAPKWTPALRRAHLALALAELGKSEDAREEIGAVAEEVLDHWGWGRLSGPAVLADVSWLLSETQWAAATYECLLRWPNRHVVVGVAACSLGASDRYLGQLATLLGRLDEADAHFEDAHRLHERLGSPGWLAHGRVDQARMLLARRGPGDLARARDLVAAARETYRALGMTVHDRRAAALTDAPSAPEGRSGVETGTFALEGEYWAIDYGDAQARLGDSKGLRYLARLLSAPGQELHALDLVVGDGGRAGVTPQAARQSGLEAVGNGDAGAVLGGRDRKAASDPERARQSVTRAIKGAVERIAEAHPRLGDHLRTTVRTGIYSSYVPDPRAPIRWNS